MGKRNHKVTNLLTWLVITAQILALLSTATMTVIQPTPALVQEIGQQTNLINSPWQWVIDTAAQGAGLVQSIFGAPKSALAEANGFLLTASGVNFTCALNSNSGVQCWGANNYGQLGNGTTTANLIPVQVTGLTSGVVDLAAGDYFVCALTSAGGVKCWGRNNNGQLGNNDTSLSSSNVPVDVYHLQTGVVQIDAGGNYACVVTKQGGAKCWGGNQAGQIGDGGVGQALWPVDVVGLRSDVAQISAGGGWGGNYAYSHTCAVLTDGTAKCWGDDTHGALGNTGTDSPTPATVAVDTSGTAVTGFMSISAGSLHSCGVMTTGAVKCWGYNASGAVGDGTALNKNFPTAVSGLSSGAANISAGDDYSCAALADGSAKCWGANTNGKLGDGTVTNRNAPVPVSGLSSGVAAISTSLNGDHSCAALTAGGVRCWGLNGSGQLGNNSITNSNTPVNVGSFVGLQVTTPMIKLIPAGGLNFNNQNLNTTATAQTATIYNGSAAALTISSISLTGTNANQFAISGGTCGSTFPLTVNGGATCTAQITFTPTSLGGKSAGLTVASNANNAASITVPLAGVGVTVGAGAPTITSNGGLDTASVQVFENGVFVTAVTAQGASPISFAVFGGADASLFNIDQTGNLRFNSAPNFEAPGDADHNNIYNVIVAVQNNVDTAIQEIFVTVQDAPDTFSSVIAVGVNFSCAVVSGGGVKCWGANNYGQLGDSTTVAKTVPTPVSGLTSGVVAVAAGDYFACALTSGGGVKCWGRNEAGQLGTGSTNTTANSTPADVTSLTSVAQIDAGGNHICVVTTAGGAKCWGGNQAGQLGVGGTGNVSSPADVSGLTSGVAQISAGGGWGGNYAYSHSCAVLTNGTAKCWGDDTHGALGNAGADSPTPATVAVDANGAAVTGFMSISAGSLHSCGVMTTGAVKCWGYNASGAVGDGTALNKNFPTDLTTLAGAVNPGGVGVASISAGNDYTCAALTDGSAKCWGNNTSGRLGDGTITNRNVPVHVNGLSSSVVAISTSMNGDHTCAATNDGNVKCWGLSISGQLGYGAITAVNYYPVMAGDATNPVAAPTTPTINLSPASGGSIAFGSQAVNTSSAPQTVTINNSGVSPLSIEGASVTGSNYAISGGTCGASFPVLVNVGANCTLQITFTPISAGLKASTLTITSNSGGQTTNNTISLSGTGAAATAPAITSNGGGATASVNVAENSTAVTTVTASGSPAATFSLVGAADQAKFTIDTNTGALAFASAPDFETPTDSGANNVYDVTVRATNSGGTDDQAIAVTVTDVAESSPPDLTVTIGQPSPSFTANSASNVPVTVANVGSGPTTGSISVSVTLPTGTSAPASFTSGAWSCTTSGQTVTCTQAGPIAAGSSSAIQLPVTPSVATVGTTPGPFNGSATTTGETNTGNNGATPMMPTTPVAPASAGAPDLTVTIGQPSPSFVGGSASNVPVTVANVGSGPTTGSISVSVTLPTGTSAPASFTSGAWSCTTSGQTVTCTQAGPIAAGGSSAIQLPVTPSVSTVGTTPSPFNGTATTTGETNTGNNGATPMTPTTPVAPAATNNGSIKVILGGAYDPATGLMRENLRTLAGFPLTSPYGDGASISNSSVLTANHIVDWVLVELRNATTPATVSASKAALLQYDGDVVGTDGVTMVSFTGLSASSYYVAIKHRNHLGAMTSSAVSVSGGMVTVDFTAMTATYGSNAQRYYNNKYMLWPGDANGDRKIIMAGPNNDTNGILTAVLGDANNSAGNANYTVRGYNAGDVNLDGKVLAAGPNNDRNVIGSSIFLYPTNSNNANYVINQQLP